MDPKDGCSMAYTRDKDGCHSYKEVCRDSNNETNHSKWQEPTPEVIATCRLPPKGDKCENPTEKWFFDKVFGYCESFNVGCKENENNFDSEEECMKFCGNVGGCPMADMGYLPPKCDYEYFEEDGCPFSRIKCPEGVDPWAEPYLMPPTPPGIEGGEIPPPPAPPAPAADGGAPAPPPPSP